MLDVSGFDVSMDHLLPTTQQAASESTIAHKVHVLFGFDKILKTPQFNGSFSWKIACKHGR